MAAGLMAIPAYMPKPLPFFDDPYAYPYATNKTTDLGAFVPHNHNHAHSRPGDNVAVFSVPVSDTPSARVPASHEPSSSYMMPQRALIQTSHHSFSVTPTLSNADERACNDAQEILYPEPIDPTPPPVPPKSPIHTRPKSVKSVSIVAPTDISPGRRVSSHSLSEFGHSYRAHTSIALASSESAPVRPTILNSQHLPVCNSLADNLSLSSDAALAIPSSMEPVTHKMSSIRARRNRLQKARPPSPTIPPSSSVLSLLLSRAFGSGDALASHYRPRSEPNMTDRSYRPIRSRSDGGSKAPLLLPFPNSRSATTDSSCTASSSASTSVSYASTTLTTPDSTSPGLSPRSSTRINKLRKKRPSLAPSSYQFPYGAHSAALGRSKSTPNGLGQRTPRNRIWSSVAEARHAAEADACGTQGSAEWYPSAQSTDASPSRRSTLGPILEVRRKTSSQALSDLACTGLCSTSIAAHSSQLALAAESPEGVYAVHHQLWQDSPTDAFNPYIECAPTNGYSSRNRNSDESHTFPISDPSSSSSSAESPANTGESSSGFAVVHGYLDRSEDAMRRWTLAMADVPDEVLVHHLERLRKESVAMSRGRLPGRRSAAPSQIGHGDEELTIDTRDRRSSFFFGGPREMGVSPRSSSRARFSVGHYSTLDGDDSDEEALSDEEDEEDWKTARQVLFCCRELVQTERNYQARLRELASTELSHHYASLVAKYIPALLRVSETLFAHVIDDPSAWGVSAAFIGCEEELEAAFVAWSTVAGEFFVEDANLRPPRKLTKKLAEDTTTLGHDSGLDRVMRTRSQIGFGSSNRTSVASRRFSSAMSESGHSDPYTNLNSGHASTGIFTAALGTGLAFGLSVPASQSPSDADTPTKTVHRLSRVSTVSSGLGRAMTAWKRKTMPASMSNIASLVSPPPTPVPLPLTPSNQGHGPLRNTSNAYGMSKRSEQDAKLSVRDLAIQPTQRVMRYVLQYRDLLDHTPAASPSRPLVERAYESALRIAKRCDRAQAHAAFLRQSGATIQKRS